MSTTLRRGAAVAIALAPFARKVGGFVVRWLKNEPRSENEQRAFTHLNHFAEAVMDDVFHRTFTPKPLEVVK